MSAHAFRSISTAAVAALVLAAGLTAAPTTANAASARSNLYSVAAINRYCTEAQKKLLNITRRSVNIVHYAYSGVGGISDFTFSSSAPYEGPNLSAYNGKDTPGTMLPLTTQQLVTYRDLPGTDMEIPVLVSCKMKDAEAVNFHFPGSNAVQGTCKSINVDMANKVYASLTAYEIRYLKYQLANIVFDEDEYAPSGPTWLGLLPTFLPYPAYIGDDNKLHIYSYSITVPRNFVDPNVGNDKKGSYYCHLISPEYFRGLVTGQITTIF